ncbi:hypothetical protein N7462_006820 [Penicillium macrosclerotiorum]|uniref:uncharacterized protein n=1 Tax=Penicillium macrosclerotiorum TaxID=303699 RepID=UPI0025466343|nr:uncharacterized protein N7462_006820 [Penicillium macrosclerotiorum]KAJ5683655.1 hypothetical protein N7462_006820 [Penicillium macrosclerotiorum]
MLARLALPGEVAPIPIPVLALELGEEPIEVADGLDILAGYKVEVVREGPSLEDRLYPSAKQGPSTPTASERLEEPRPDDIPPVLLEPTEDIVEEDQLVLGTLNAPVARAAIRGEEDYSRLVDLVSKLRVAYARERGPKRYPLADPRLGRPREGEPPGLEERIERSEDYSGNPVLLAGTVRAALVAYEYRVVLELSIEVGLEYRERGVANSAADILLGTDYRGVERESIEPRISEEVVVPYYEDLLYYVIVLDIPEPLPLDRA